MLKGLKCWREKRDVQVSNCVAKQQLETTGDAIKY